jgi:hypothetical protein
MKRALFVGLFFLFATVSPASAALPAELWKTPEDGVAGEGAAQFHGAGGIAVDPTSGHLYVGDESNARVDEFDAWGQFVKAWGWGVRDGSPELQTCGPAEPESNPPPGLCRKGLEGSGLGQFELPRGGIAVDSTSGDVYVGDMLNHRVEKFDPTAGPDGKEAEFLLAFGSAGEGDGQFADVGFGNHIGVDPTGTVFAGDTKGRIQEFESDGAFKSKVTLEGELEGHAVGTFATDASGNFYVTVEVEGDRDRFRKFGPSGALLATFSMPSHFERADALTLDAVGNIYVPVRENRLTLGYGPWEVAEFAPNGAPVIAPGAGFATQEETLVPSGLATNIVTADGVADIYTASSSVGGLAGGASINFLSAYGPPPDKWAPPKHPPEIKSQYALTVNSDSATVGAAINPRFWADTRYYVEWGVGKCSEGGCVNRAPVAPGSELKAGIVNSAKPTKTILLSGLVPDTDYHYRFVAQSTGGGPVHGVGVGEAEGVFHTPRAAFPPNTDCPNQIFHSGASARLPDCRAYEMVSPVDKNGTDIVSLININSNLAALRQSAAAGEKLTYTTSQGFGDTQGVPYVSQYIASRGADGWQNHAITPPQGLSGIAIGHRIDLDYRAFTEDLCVGVLQHTTEPPLASDAVEGYANLYRRQNCGPGADTFDALTTAKPPTRPVNNYFPEAQGLSADGRCTVFFAEDQLTPDAAPGLLPGGGSRRQLYESCGGVLSLLSVLPNGSPNTTEASVGTLNGNGLQGPRGATDASAVSSDGSRVYWTASDGRGKLYVRVNTGQEQSKVAGGKCTEEEKACTIKVSESVTGAEAHFWRASADGSRALFSIEESTSPLNGNLYEFDLESRKSTLVATKVTGVMGTGEEAFRAYFLSEEVLAGANVEGDSPVGGRPNLYFYEKSDEGKSTAFIATLSTADASLAFGIGLSPVAFEPHKKTSRVTPDGRAVAFMASAQLTGYDNTDQASGQADNEVYLYDADTGKLSCASCNPTGQRPSGRDVKVEGQAAGLNWSAALLPRPLVELYGTRVISADGSRLFFDSYEALVPRDTNGKADVYEWETPGSGDCEESSPTYSPPNNGCLSLISSGQSPTDSEFVDASADATDVFFTTSSSLLPQDPGLIDIYDARAGGGYPAPPEPTPACEGEACQGPLAPPNDPTPGSSSFDGAGNVVEEGKAKKHKKVKHKKTTRQGKHKRKAHADRGN